LRSFKFGEWFGEYTPILEFENGCIRAITKEFEALPPRPLKVLNESLGLFFYSKIIKYSRFPRCFGTATPTKKAWTVSVRAFFMIDFLSRNEFLKVAGFPKTLILPLNYSRRKGPQINAWFNLIDLEKNEIFPKPAFLKYSGFYKLFSVGITRRLYSIFFTLL